MKVETQSQFNGSGPYVAAPTPARGNGSTGQTVVGVVTGGAVVLVWTGIALAFRRLLATRKRGRVAVPKAA